VVDAQGRVHGTDNLWVADASIMPRIPGAPTHLTVLMIAEKIAAGLREGH
jgi:choline dehydrogenase-like flavoprotein